MTLLTQAEAERMLAEADTLAKRIALITRWIEEGRFPDRAAAMRLLDFVRGPAAPVTEIVADKINYATISVTKVSAAEPVGGVPLLTVTTRSKFTGFGPSGVKLEDPDE